MAVSNYIQNKLLQDVAQHGRDLLSVKYPNDIEVYLVALELANSKGETEQYFVFPVMPQSINKVEQNRTSIKKSSYGTTVLMSPSYSPSEISIKGDFGRSFKLLTNPSGSEFAFGVYKNNLKDKFSTVKNSFDASVKTGFGCIKILQDMVKMSSQLDSDSKPYRLYFYNMALGEAYLVSVLPGGLTLSQNYDRNMIWTYSLTMHAIANLEDLKSSADVKKSSKSILNSKSIQNGVNLIVGEVKSLL